MEPFDFAGIRQALHHWLRQQTGLQVIWGHQNAPPPSCPFASLTLLSGPTAVTPLDELRGTSEGGGQRLTAQGPRTLTVSCHVYAKAFAYHKTATDYLLKAQASLRLPSVRDGLGRAGLTVLEDLGIQELPESMGPSWRSRAHVDIRCAVTSRISEPVQTLDSIALTGDLTHESR